MELRLLRWDCDWTRIRMENVQITDWDPELDLGTPVTVLDSLRGKMKILFIL